MSKQKEGRLKTKVKYILEKIPNTWWLITNPMWAVGTPDIIGCVGGKFFAIELKYGDGKTSIKQDHELTRLGNAGAETFICNEKTFLGVMEYLAKKGGDYEKSKG